VPDSFDCALLQPLAVLDPLYVKPQGASAAFLPRALRAAGVLDAEEAWLLESYLVERGEATLPLAAALTPRSWRAASLEGWCQEIKPGRAMHLLHPALVLPAIMTEARRQSFRRSLGLLPLPAPTALPP